jgi:hypothetical protein
MTDLIKRSNTLLNRIWWAMVMIVAAFIMFFMALIVVYILIDDTCPYPSQRFRIGEVEVPYVIFGWEFSRNVEVYECGRIK